MLFYPQFWRHARRSRKLSQREFGQLAGVGSQFVSNVERGRGHYSAAHLRRLIRLLEIDPQLVVEIAIIREEECLRRAFNFKKVCGTE